jgi:ABC-2 type transport system ATP-binding protein
MEGGIAISIEGLSKHFGTLRAVDGIDLKVLSGEVFALLGPNGAGKTTTLTMLCGLMAPTSGTARVAGHDVQKDPLSVRKSIGMVFQQPSIDDLLTGRENLRMHALLYGMRPEGREERIGKMLSLVALTDRAESQMREYSGGMRKRLELVRGILHHPRILFLDEPTVGLDPQTRAHIWQYIRKLSDTEGVTVVFTTHYLEEAEQFADRVAIIDHGKVCAVGTPSELVEGLGGDSAFLATKKPKEVAAKARKMPFVKSVKAEKNGVRLRLEKSHLNLPRLLRELKGIDAIDIRRASLNDVFIKFTGREIREEEGEGSVFERMMK